MKKFLSFLLIIPVLFTGCDLEEDPKSILTPGNYYTTKSGMETLVYSCYSLLRFIGGGTDLLKLNHYGTDVVQAGVSNHPARNDSYDMPTTEGALSGLWTNAYTIINACNNVTYYLPMVPDMTEAQKTLREAEARFIRAKMYFHLTIHFGEVHHSMEPSLDVETEAYKTPFNTVWDETIYPDLRFAVANLPARQSDYGRIDQWGAKHFLAYALLNDPRSGKAQFDEAALLLADIINNSHYQLQENRYLVFSEDNENNSEIIWSIQFCREELYNQGGNYSHMIWVTSYQDCPGMVRTQEYGRSFIQYRPTQFFFDLLDETIDSRYDAYWRDTWFANRPENVFPLDVTRKINGADVSFTLNHRDTSIVMPKRPWTIEMIDSKAYRVFNPENATPITGLAGDAPYWNQDLRYYPTLKKFDDTKRATPDWSQGNRNYSIFRLADTYLLACEAYYRGGNTAEAVKYMNVLRRNAALPGKENEMEITEAQLDIDFILDERARELIGEDYRWTDLKRLGKLPERASLNPYFPSTGWKDYYYLRPYPQSHIDRCSNEWTQNPGW